MKHNLIEVDLLIILHDLKCLISAYDTIVGWATRWNSNNVIFDSSSNYKFIKYDQLLKDLATRYYMTNTKLLKSNKFRFEFNISLMNLFTNVIEIGLCQTLKM